MRWFYCFVCTNGNFYTDKIEFPSKDLQSAGRSAQSLADGLENGFVHLHESKDDNFIRGYYYKTRTR